MIGILGVALGDVARSKSRLQHSTHQNWSREIENHQLAADMSDMLCTANCSRDTAWPIVGHLKKVCNGVTLSHIAESASYA